MKANHNVKTSLHVAAVAVFNMSKIQIWKRITTLTLLHSLTYQLYLICQRYKFESESQPEVVVQPLECAVFNMSKIQIWKRITTQSSGQNEGYQLYLICQRYKFESESQRMSICFFNVLAVFNMSKIQIWKRITTYKPVNLRSSALYLICQRYKFESESQLRGTYGRRWWCCI